MNASSRFAGKTAIVTGAGSGFGRAIASRLAAEGAAVVVADVNTGNGQAVADSLVDTGAKALFQHTDVSDAHAVEALIQRTVDAFGGVDILVNNAGFSHLSGPAWELSEDEYDRVFATNTKGVWLGCKYAIPVMQRGGGGVIINTASIGAVAPRPGVTVYNATKGAVMTMTRGLAVELARYNIRVNAVNPVAADTGFMKSALGTDELPDANRAALIKGIPLRRLTEPEDVAASVCFLASEEASFLTGVCLPVDGGRSIS
ncbi:MAG: SDR family oxidoreductase [Proteobacteria bacterium]|nr:SDR family oxidoreductase [Pseudomonadota bacterium]